MCLITETFKTIIRIIISNAFNSSMQSSMPTELVGWSRDFRTFGPSEPFHEAAIVFNQIRVAWPVQSYNKLPVLAGISFRALGPSVKSPTP